MPTRSPATAAVAIPAARPTAKTSWSERAAGRKTSFVPAKASVIFAQVYAPTAMKPAWPSENWPVNPFTTLSETARTTLIPTAMSTMVQSSQPFASRKSCTAKKSGAPRRKGRSERSVARARPTRPSPRWRGRRAPRA